MRPPSAARARKPRVAVVLSGYGIVERGAETLLAQLLPRLEDRIDLHVFSRSGRGPGGVRRKGLPRELLAGIHARTPLVRKVLDTLFLDPLHVEWTSHLAMSLPALIRGRYDVVWHETGLWGGLALAAVRRLTGVRLLDVAHASHPGWEVPFARRRPDVFITSTRFFADLIRRHVPGLRVEVVPPGVDRNSFRPGVAAWPLTVGSTVVLAVGALAQEKRPRLLVESVALTTHSLVLAGDGPLAAEIDDLAHRLLGPGRYQRLQLPRAEMPRLYAAASVVALASPHEGFGFAALEALACGKPVVSVDDEVRREVIGSAGELVAGSAPAAWAAAVERTISRTWDDAPLQQASRFDLGTTAERYAEILIELAEAES